MTSLAQNLSAGLLIFDKYPEIDIACLHNEIRVLADVTEEDAIKLSKLGWWYSTKESDWYHLV